MGNKTRHCSLRKDRKAISPAISSVIMTSSVVVLLLISIVFANNFLGARMAENEYSAIKQFMQTIGLQVDDVAWTIGRTQTMRYASKYGAVNFETVCLNYTVYLDKGNGYVYFSHNTTGALLFNMPISKYSIANNYQHRIVPSDRSFLQTGTSAPVAHIFEMEKIPMADGNYIRVVVAPSIRMLNSTINNGGLTKNYYKFYLCALNAGLRPRYSQSVTLAGSGVEVRTESAVNKVKIHLSFPKSTTGFDDSFFNFDGTDKEVDVPDGSIIEVYTGKVIVSLGLYA